MVARYITRSAVLIYRRADLAGSQQAIALAICRLEPRQGRDRTGKMMLTAADRERKAAVLQLHTTFAF